MIRYLMGISTSRLCYEETFARLRPLPLPAYSPNSKNQSSVWTYYFVVGNAQVMLDKEENYQNKLAERICFLEESDMERDFWLVIEPKFLDNFPMLTSILERPAVAIVSTSSSWITLMESTLKCVLSDSYTAESQEEALACTPGKWAPYPKTEPGWWEPFLSAKSENQKAHGSLEPDGRDVYFDDGSAEVVRSSLRLVDDQESKFLFKSEVLSQDDVSSTNETDFSKSSTVQSGDVEKSNIGELSEQGDFDVSSPVCHPYEGICTPCSTNNVDKPADTEGGSTGAA